MLRHIAWFNEAAIEPDPHGGLKSPDDGVRRRCLKPAHELERLGVPCSVFGNLCDADPAAVARHLEQLGTNIVVIACITSPSFIQLAETAKALGCEIVIDCDGENLDTPHLAQLIGLADHVVAATPHVAQQLARYNLSLSIIPDCSESGEEHAPAMLAMLWLDCFKKLGMKLPPVANTNLPLSDNG